MLKYSPKRSSRLANVVSEWSKIIKDTIKENKGNNDFLFAFFLRDPFDDNLHICIDENTIPAENNIKDKWDKIDKDGKEQFLNYIKSTRANEDKYIDIIKDELDESAGEEFETTLMALLHSFPYPMTQKIKQKNDNVYSCVDDRLYYKELFEANHISDIVEVLMIPRNGLPDFKIKENGDVCYSQKPTDIAQNNDHKTALTMFLEVYGLVSDLPEFTNDFKGLLMPIRNGRSNREGSLLGFINFACCNDNIGIIKDLLGKNLDLIHLQINSAFLEGTLFEIEQGLEELIYKNLVDLTKSYLNKLTFTRTYNGKGTPLNLVINYNEDIPYELRRTMPTLKEFENGVITQCFCPFVNGACKKGCEDYQKGKILELIIRLAQIKHNQQRVQNAITRHGSKAAITAIVARNLSHNIGSHVLARWIGELNKWLNDNEILEKITPEEWNRELDRGTRLFMVSETYKKLGSSKPLFQYIQHRMDFIATVATSTPSSEMTMDFMKDVFMPFKEPKVLLENIAASEGFDDLAGRFDVDVPGNCGRVSIPNGIIGTHAIYSILENFIRNAAKHCNSHLLNDFDIPEPFENIKKYTCTKMNEDLRNAIFPDQQIDIFRKKTEFVRHLNSIIKDRDFSKRIDTDVIGLDEWAKSTQEKIEENGKGVEEKEVWRLNRHIIDKVFEKRHNGVTTKHIIDTLGFKIELEIPNRVKLNNKPNNGKNVANGKVEFKDNNILTINKDKNNQTFMLTKGEQEDIIKLFSNEDDKKTLKRFFYIHESYIKLRIWDMREGSCNAEILENLRKFLNGKDKEGRFINDEGMINPDGWGIKEMVVSSNFLRKYSPEKLIDELDEKEPSIMEIMCNDDPEDIACKNGGNNCHRSGDYKDRLGIRLYLRRPKDMYILCNDNVTIDKDKFEIVAEKRDERLKEDIPHRLLYINESEKLKYEEDQMAPMRIMTYKYNVNNGNAVNDKFYLKKYEEFIKKLGGCEELPKLCYKGGGKSFTITNNNKALITNINLHNLHNLHNNDAEAILFYYHADKPDKSNTFIELLNNNKIWFQPVSGKFTSVLSKLDTLPHDELYQRHFLLELIESALTRVLIIDERVSDLADKEAFHGKTVCEILKNMKIDCLKVDKENITYKSIQVKLQAIKALNAQKNGSSKKLKDYEYHFLVIHQGILDKMKKSIDNGNKLEKLRKLIQKIDYRWMVIDSGRGVPKELKESEYARFVETSALLKMLEEYDKHGLVQTLFSLRRPLIEKTPDRKEEIS